MTAQALTAESAWKGRRWIVFILALILLNMTICAVTVYAAKVSQPPIERGYDAKALKWDVSNEQREVNRKLGWRAVYSVDHQGGPSPRIVAELLDSSGRPMRTATCSMQIASDAAPNRASIVRLDSHDDGTYSAPLPTDAAGWMNVTLSVEAGGLRYVETTRMLVSRSSEERRR